jgi:predicted metalloprotease with PDZ domain
MIQAVRAFPLLLALAAMPLPATAADPVARSRPTAIAPDNSVPQAADVPYPGGPITLEIDASDVTRALWRVTETIPLAPGTRQLIVQLPEWIPGHHAVGGTIDQLGALKFAVAGQTVRWWRDPVEVFAFHIELPMGATAVTASFIVTSPLQEKEGRVTMTPEMLNLQWDRMSLYPAGHYVRQIRVRPTVTLPAGWELAGAPDGRQRAGNKVSFAETDYETLVDSPLFAGKNFRRIDLGHNVALNLFADKPADLAITPENAAAYKALVEEAGLTFGTYHFDHYDFLLALSDRLGGIGLEHHRSSENSQEPRSLVEWKDFDWDRNVVAHEFGHSWNGKFRRPDRLWTPDYRQPMQDNLLWVYEGQNQFWGLVLAARSGVQSKDVVLGEFASYAGQFSQWPGREWRSVEDTTFDEIMNHRRPKPFASLMRNEDYYTEGALIWLEADQVIRTGTAGRKGLDDFARLFFGLRDGDWGEVPYSFDDVVAALNTVYPYDWAGFLKERIDRPGQPVPLAGIERAGYRLVWKEEPNPYDKGRFADAKVLSLLHSLGINLDRDGRVTSSRWGSAAFDAGVVSGAKVLAVNGDAYDQDVMRAAIKSAKGTSTPIALIIQRGDKVQSVSIDYHDGLRYPWLERAAARGPAPLDLLLAPRRR